MKLIKRLALVTISSLILPTFALASDGNPFEGWGFIKDDWQLVCDNTLTCRAAGYSEGGLQSGTATILLTVIPKESAIKAQLMLQNVDDEEASPANAWLAHHGSRVSLYLNNKDYGMVDLNSRSLSGTLSSHQTQQILAQARQNTKIEFRSGQFSWPVSDRGLSAVLLKLDEVQGRVGTPLALISKNAQQRMVPKYPKPMPIIFAAPVYPSNTPKPYLNNDKVEYWRANINSWVTATAKEELDEDCYLLNPKNYNWPDDKEWTFTPLDAEYTLARHACWRGAYNEGNGFWVIDHRTPSEPTLVTYSGGTYDDGHIINGQRGRGLGDCVFLEEWTWNGTTFVKSSAMTTGLCRMIQLGGAWDLPTVISEVIPPKSEILGESVPPAAQNNKGI